METWTNLCIIIIWKLKNICQATTLHLVICQKSFCIQKFSFHLSKLILWFWNFHSFKNLEQNNYIISKTISSGFFMNTLYHYLKITKPHHHTNFTHVSIQFRANTYIFIAKIQGWVLQSFLTWICITFGKLPHHNTTTHMSLQNRAIPYTLPHSRAE